MVTIQVPIYADRAATIRAGLDPAAESIAVDLGAITQGERDLLADHIGAPITVTTPTVEDLFEALRAKAAAADATLAEILAAHRAVLRERRVKTWQEPIVSSGEETYEVAAPDWPHIGRGAAGATDPLAVMAKHRDKVHEITHGEQAAAWRRELDEINKNARERALQEWREAEEAKERAREAGIAELKEWATRNGSERVRLLIEENMASWYGLAEDEYFAAHTPEGFTLLTDEDVVRSLPVPDAPDIHALREARRIAADDDALTEPHLVWIGKVDGTGQASGHSAVRLVITGPHGARCLVWRPVGDEPAPGG